jgi:hypothetical protein
MAKHKDKIVAIYNDKLYIHDPVNLNTFEYLMPEVEAEFVDDSSYPDMIVANPNKKLIVVYNTGLIKGLNKQYAWEFDYSTGNFTRLPDASTGEWDNNNGYSKFIDYQVVNNPLDYVYFGYNYNFGSE